MRWTSTPMTPEPLPARAERRDRQPREVAHRALRAVAQRGGDLPAQLLEVDVAALAAALDAAAATPSLTPSTIAAASAARKKKRSKTSSKMRRSSWDFASVAASASRKSAGSVHGISLEHGERVEQLRRPAVDALGAQLGRELDEPRGDARGRARRRLRAAHGAAGRGYGPARSA